MLKIAIVGPESSGKTTLAEALAEHYHGRCVPEVSREYLELLDRPYVERDLLAIARSLGRSHAGEDDPVAMVKEGNVSGRGSPVFYDTDTLNLWIWSMEKYGRVHPVIDWMVRDTRYTWRLLCRPDIPWVPDPLRENPHDRDRLFDIWERELKAHGFPYTIIGGTPAERLADATRLVAALVARGKH